MTRENMNDHEVVSALADGQLKGSEFVHAINLLEASSELRSTWHAYHVVGDILRSGDCVSTEKDNAFLQRLRSNLAEQPLPVHMSDSFHNAVTGDEFQSQAKALPAENDSRFRWKAWGGLASILGVSFLALQMFSTAENSQGFAEISPQMLPTQLAAGRGLNAYGTGADRAVMIRDPRLDALLAAHQQLGGTSAFQNPTGFVRNATFTGAGR